MAPSLLVSRGERRGSRSSVQCDELRELPSEPVSGSSSQIAEIRAGHFGPDLDHPGQLAFIEHPGGSLVHQRAINPAI